MSSSADRPQAGTAQRIHLITAIAAVAAGIFAFVAMQVAFDARDAADEARANTSMSDTWTVETELRELHQALLDAGVIEDHTGRFGELTDEG